MKNIRDETKEEKKNEKESLSGGDNVTNNRKIKETTKRNLKTALQ